MDSSRRALRQLLQLTRRRYHCHCLHQDMHTDTMLPQACRASLRSRTRRPMTSRNRKIVHSAVTRTTALLLVLPCTRSVCSGVRLSQLQSSLVSIADLLHLTNSLTNIRHTPYTNNGRIEPHSLSIQQAYSAMLSSRLSRL